MTRLWPIKPQDDLLARLCNSQDPLSRLVLDDSTGPACVIDAQYRLHRANTALAQLTADPTCLRPGQDVCHLFDPASQAQAAEAIARVLAKDARTPIHFTARLATPAEPDQDHVLHVTAQPIAASSQPAGALLRLTDLSTQRRLEAQLAHSQKLQATGQLAGGIAHDFNNLLTVTLGAADAILARDPHGETHEDAAQIRNAALRGAALVRQLLAFGRQQRLTPQVIAVNDALANLANLLRRLLGASIHLSLDLEHPGRRIRADPTQLDQVLINLAVNARNAMPGGGTLTLRSAHITLYRPLQHGIETIPPGRYVTIEVADTGCGIPPDILPRIFEPFFTTRREQGGSGLGLSTVHGIIRQSAGFLAVDSTPGAGTTMRLYLPRCDDEPEPPAPPAPLTQPAPRTGPILLVEDEDPVRRLASRALHRAGWTVIEAISGEDALESLDQHPEPRAVITDLVMPGLDGETLSQALRERLNRPDLPVILVSGYTQSQANSRVDAPNTIFLAKPYSLAHLVETLDHLLTRTPVIAD